MKARQSVTKEYFDEAWYLAKYPDVAGGVARGELPSGYDHFAAHGQREKREFRFCANNAYSQLRLCAGSFRYTFYACAERLEVPTIASEQSVQEFLSAEFKKRELIRV